MERQEVSTKSMTWKLIGWQLVWGILSTIILRALMGITNNIVGKNLFLYVVISLILSAVISYITWQAAISSAFKKSTISRMQADSVIRNLMIITVILSVLSCIINISNSKNFSKELEDSPKLKMANMMSKYLSEEEKLEYDETLEKAQKQVSTYTVVIGICGIFINVGALALNKKNIYNKTIDGAPATNVLD